MKKIRIDQAHLGDVVLDRVLTAWLSEAVLIEGYLPQYLCTGDAEYPHQWLWDGFEHVDPAKEANAQSTRLASNAATLAVEFAKQGLDWESELRQRGREATLMRELGLTMEQAAPKTLTTRSIRPPAGARTTTEVDLDCPVRHVIQSAGYRLRTSRRLWIAAE